MYNTKYIYNKSDNRKRGCIYGKVKVVSKNNQVSVKVKSTKDEQLNQNMAELLSNTAVEGFLLFI
ncbi:MAG: hypothetical protein ACLRMX_05285 [Lachnospira eligens]